MKTKQPVHIRVFGVITSDFDVLPPFIFSHHSTWRPTSNARRRLCRPGSRKLLLKKKTQHLDTGLGIKPHPQKNNKQSWLSDNFCGHITPNIWSPNPPDYYLLDNYAWGAVEKETNKTVSKMVVDKRVHRRDTFDNFLSLKLQANIVRLHKLTSIHTFSCFLIQLLEEEKYLFSVPL